MTIAKHIQNEQEYDAALDRVTALMDDLSGPDGQIDDPNHPNRIELDALVASIEAYEAVHHPIEQTNFVAISER